MKTRSTFVAIGLTLALATPGSAATTTSVEVTSATASGGTIVVRGTLALGDDATAPILVGEDPEGDSTAPGLGTDFGDVTIAANPVARRLTYAIEVYDMLPGIGQMAPAYGYTLPIAVDGNFGPGYFLASGNAGSSFPPAAGPWRALCTAPAGSYGCETPLTGTMTAAGITIELPYSRVGIAPGSLVEPGSAVGCGGGICTTVWAGLLFNNAGGDSGFLAGYKVPGEVMVGIAPAGTPPNQVVTDTPAEPGTGGQWTATTAAAPGSHIVVARSCWGNNEALRCAEGHATISV